MSLDFEEPEDSRAILKQVVVVLHGPNPRLCCTIDTGISDGEPGGDIVKRTGSTKVVFENTPDRDNPDADLFTDCSDIMDVEIKGETLREYLNRVVFAKAQDKKLIPAGTVSRRSE